MKQSVGLVGWRGMVGSVLMQRMRDEGDFALIDPVFFSTSNAGGRAPEWVGATALQNAFDIDALKKLPIILTAQGGDYTSEVYPNLRAAQHHVPLFCEHVRSHLLVQQNFLPDLTREALLLRQSLRRQGQNHEIRRCF